MRLIREYHLSYMAYTVDNQFYQRISDKTKRTVLGLGGFHL